MKQIFKCEYCNFMGTEDVVKPHEETCVYNGEKKDCRSCKYVSYKFPYKDGTMYRYTCKKGKEIPEGKQFLNCDLHETRDSTYSDYGIKNNPFFLF